MNRSARLFFTIIVALLATAVAPAGAFATYGKIKVVKDLIPSTDTGRFDLKIDGSTVKSNAGDGDWGSNDRLSAHSTHTVSESGTSLADYDSSIKCTKNGTTIQQGSGTSLSDIPVKVGDYIICTITNTRKPAKGKVEIEKQTDPGDSDASFGFTAGSLTSNFSLSDDDVRTITNVTPNQTYTVTEPATTGWRLTGITCNDSDSSGSTSTRAATIKVSPGETVRCTFFNKKIDAAIKIVKSGPALVHHGDSMTFGFAVTIPAGSAPVKDVTVTDDHCAPVTLTSKSPGDTDEWLEQGETWNYTCTTTAPAAHVDGEANPIHNIATTTGKDEWNRPVTDTDDHDTKIIHPAINIEKTGDRTTTKVGETVKYLFDVTNVGDTPLTSVSFGDPRCDANTLTGPNKQNGNDDAWLEVGELWHYECTHLVLSTDEDPLTNRATTTGVDILGGPKGTVTDEDTFVVDILPTDTIVPPTVTSPAVTPPGVIQVLGQQALSGRATLTGQTGCASRAFTATVSGRQIRRVTFYVDGKRVRVVNARSGRTRFTARVSPAGRRLGVHRVTARVLFAPASGTRARTLVLTFQRCGRQARPVFTG